MTAWQGVRRSCRIAAEALEQVRQLRWGSFGGNPAAPAGGVRRQPGSSAPEVQSISPLELPDCHRAPSAGCAGLPPKLWRQSGSPAAPAALAAPAGGAGRQSGSSAPGEQSLSSPCRGSWTSESQCQSSFPPIILNHGRDIPQYQSLLVEVPETSEAVVIIHNIILGTHSFSP